MNPTQRRSFASRFKYGLLLLPLAVLVISLFIGYSANLSNWRAAQATLKRAQQAANAAFELKFQSADLNGWQTAYAFDFGRHAVPADHVQGRKQFLAAAQKFGLQTAEVRRHLATAEELQAMSQLEDTFRSFMSTDAEIFAAYQSGDPERIRAANDQVLGIEIERFETITRLADTVVQFSRKRTEQGLYAHYHTATQIWKQLWGIEALGLAVAAALTLLLIKSMRKAEALVVELGKQALTDPLTELPNRRIWDSRIGVELARAERLAYPLALVVIDLDHFKAFNDEFGHIKGDELLRSAARAWQQTLREGDLLARVGGEEFALLLPGCTADDASALVERLRPVVPFRQTFSAGIALWSQGENSVELFSRADAALYQAKMDGRNRTTIAAKPVIDAGARPGRPRHARHT